MDVVQLWKDASNDKLASALISIFMLVCLVLIAIYVVGWFRNLAVGKEVETNPLAEIERLKSEGKISQFEYQRLKKAAAQSMSGDKLIPQKNGAEVLTLKEAQLRKAQARQNESEHQTSPNESGSEEAG